HVTARPEAVYKGSCIAFGQTYLAHFGSRVFVVVVDRVMHNRNAIFRRAEDAEPNSGRAVIRWHANRARIVPKAAINDLGERQTAMTCNDTIGLGAVDLLRLYFVVG